MNDHNKYKKLSNDLIKITRKKYNSYIKETSSNFSSNIKRFWSLVKSKCKSKKIPEHMVYKDKTATNPIDKANFFNTFFYSNFTPVDTNTNLPPVNTFRNLNLNRLEVSVAEVRLGLEAIDVNKATGPDELSGRILKECAAELAPSLTKLFNLSLKLW